MDNTRRTFLALTGLGSAAMLLPLSARDAGAVCADPATLPLSQKNRRRGLGYAEPAADASKRCGGCAFYAAASVAGCGQCQMLSGGKVSAVATCNSFAPRP